MDPAQLVAAFAGAFTANFLFSRAVRDELEALRYWASGLASRVGYPQPPLRGERAPEEH